MANKNNGTNNVTDVILTRGTKKLIQQSITEVGELNRQKICEKMCDTLCDKFTGDSLEYQLERMNLQTTSAVCDAIDTFIFKHMKTSQVAEI